MVTTTDINTIKVEKFDPEQHGKIRNHDARAFWSRTFAEAQRYPVHVSGVNRQTIYNWLRDLGLKGQFRVAKSQSGGYVILRVE